MVTFKPQRDSALTFQGDSLEIFIDNEWRHVNDVFAKPESVLHGYPIGLRGDLFYFLTENKQYPARANMKDTSFHFGSF